MLLTYVTMTCDTHNLHITHSDVDGDIIMHKLPKDGFVRAAWINATLKGKKIVQENLHTFVTISLHG